MFCPICGNEMNATGGIPTVWQCLICSKGKKKPVRYKGDIQTDLVEVS